MTVGKIHIIDCACIYLEPEIALVLSPITIMPRHEERVSHFAGKDIRIISPLNRLQISLDLATVPTVGDTFVALEDLCSDLAETLKQISDIGAELANKDYIGIDNAQEASCSLNVCLTHSWITQVQILREIDPTLLQNLAIDQKRSLLCQELQHIKTIAKHDAKFLLGKILFL